jgi:hypothetical protein
MKKNKTIKNIDNKSNKNDNKNIQLIQSIKSNNITMDFFQNLSNNKLVIGIVAIFVNIGARYIPINLTKNQEALLRNISTELLIFSITLLMSRDIKTAIILTILFSILSKYIFNENSRFCILPEQYKSITEIIDKNNDGIISDEELENAKNILSRHKDQQHFYNKIFMLNNIQ